ncbi:response regulator transcription factor [Sphingoaurantiacus capsulatus]|uniref:Response regulator transcription factor n=1 Tax=Sphingoaurantiacus capsulatus TaxID=1771310 RepID=A0ABV7X7E3_9SPHN
MNEKIVYVVDDDDAVRDSARRLLKIVGYEVETFDSANAFMDGVDSLKPGCVIFDINMPGISGLEAQKQLKERGAAFPVIILTGQGDIGKAVQAMKNGAVEFIEKPYQNEALLNAVEAGFAQLGVRLSEDAANEKAAGVVGRLSPRERQVLQGMLTGLPNKLIGHQLGLSTRTVEVYRSKVMDKLEVRSLSSAVKLALAAGLPELEAG